MKAKADGERLHREGLTKLNEAEQANQRGDLTRAQQLLREAEEKQEQSDRVYTGAMKLKSVADKLHRQAAQQHSQAAEQHNKVAGRQDRQDD